MAERRATQSDTTKHNTVHRNEQAPDNRAKAKAKTGPSRPEHNADHRNVQTPDNRGKAKAKSGPSPKTHLPSVPPFPAGEKASGSQNPESEHEPKGKAGRPRNTQPKPNNQGPPPVKKDKETPKPKHGTEQM